MTHQGYFLTAEDYRELEAISTRLAHFASIVFDQPVDWELTEASLLDLQQRGADTHTQPIAP
jgi:hypothetical protein